MYLSSPRVNIVEESVEDHRVQLQCKFDEMEGKYTEAKPRCTCPSYESNLHQVGEVQHQLPLNLMLVYFRPHLCSGYTRVVRGDINFKIQRDPSDFLFLIDPYGPYLIEFSIENGSFLLTKALFWVNFCPFRATGRKGRG